MCGRHSLKAPPERIATMFNLPALPEWEPRFNLAPSQSVLAILRPTKAADLVARKLHWGLIPRWATDPSIGNRMINAQAETAAVKPSFRESFKRRRCLVISDGFYEWHAINSKRKQPYYIARSDGDPFAFAGLWDSWTSPVGEVIDSCTILTTTPNPLMAPIHTRMPVILPPEVHGVWLDSSIEGGDVLQRLLKPYEGTDLVATPVSTYVNSPSHEGDACVQPIKLEELPPVAKKKHEQMGLFGEN